MFRKITSKRAKGASLARELAVLFAPYLSRTGRALEARLPALSQTDTGSDAACDYPFNRPFS